MSALTKTQLWIPRFNKHLRQKHDREDTMQQATACVFPELLRTRARAPHLALGCRVQVAAVTYFVDGPPRQVVEAAGDDA